jgi:hypothetical protein
VRTFRTEEGTAFQALNLHKWQLLAQTAFDVLLFADADLELVRLHLT